MSQQLVCQTCGAAFGSQRELMEHGRVHAPSKAFKCEACGATFGSQEELMKHAGVHREIGGAGGRLA